MDRLDADFGECSHGRRAGDEVYFISNERIFSYRPLFVDDDGQNLWLCGAGVKLIEFDPRPGHELKNFIDWDKIKHAIVIAETEDGNTYCYYSRGMDHKTQQFLAAEIFLMHAAKVAEARMND